LDSDGRFFWPLIHGYLHCQVKLFVNLCKLQSNINNRSWEKKCDYEATPMHEQHTRVAIHMAA